MNPRLLFCIALLQNARRNSMSLKGSQTESNLKEAFAGESQANRRTFTLLT